MKHLSLLALATLALAGTAYAVEAPQKAPAEMEKMHGKHFKEADTNGDGGLSKEEFMARHEKKFAEIDANHDGKITPDEMKAHHETMKEKFKHHRAERKAHGDAPEAAGAK